VAQLIVTVPIAVERQDGGQLIWDIDPVTDGNEREPPS
jgi:hypothetical protein